MKRKVMFLMLILLLGFMAGAVVVTVYIRKTTSTLASLVTLHQVEHHRKSLIIDIWTVQTDLFSVNTPHGHNIDRVIDHVNGLVQSSRRCFDCHHTAETLAQITEMVSLVEQYKLSLSSYITAIASPRQIERLKEQASLIGNRLLTSSESMSLSATMKLQSVTESAMRKIRTAQIVLVITVVVCVLFGAVLAAHLIRTITRPITLLVDATRTIAGGALGHTVSYHDRTEFGELAAHFNEMSTALREGYTKLQTEITERTETTKALAKSERFLSMIFDSIRDPFCIFDRKFTIIKANEAYAALKHTTAKALIGRHCFEVLYGRDTVCDDCIVSATFRSGDTCAKEKAVEAPDGTRTWLEIYTYPIVDQEGALSYVIEYTRDITARKRAQEALRESEERYALAARGANDGLWDWDLRTNRVYFSPRWKAMLGLSDHEVGDTPQEWFDRIHPDDREATEGRINVHIHEDAEHFECEYRILCRDGTYRWMLARGITVRDRNAVAHRLAGSQTDITARKQAEEQLIHDAFHDSLTGLPNRALFMNRLQHTIDSSRRSQSLPYAVLFLDVDRFKVVNDSLGHNVGDKLLVAMGRRLASCVRPGDTVARLGGDEFAVLLEQIGRMEDAADVAERIQTSLAPAYLIDRHEILSSQSIGIALRSDEYYSPDQVLRDADIAMYQAKAKGRARYEFFSPAMHTRIIERLQLEADLRLALDHRTQFVMHYQPIMDIRRHRLIGFEALVRWNHPVLGLLAPMQFIPLAEETKMIGQLGELVLELSCRQQRQWQDAFRLTPPLKMSINFAGGHFLQSDFPDRVLAIIASAGASPSSLTVEITESTIMENIDLAVENMKRLQEHGVHIHIDDFGTGYSSLSYLHSFPVNALKIDRSFISRMSQSEENREIVRTIIALARNLNIDVIAEGLEEEGQLDAVKELACPYGQGFLFARPMPPEQMPEWVRQAEGSAV